LLDSKKLTDFPSASAIEYDGQGRLYVFGDDAPYLLMMDTAYNRTGMVLYSIDSAFRIDKSEKADIESATMLTHNGHQYLYALGSFSSRSRMSLFYFPLSDIQTYLSIDYSPFAEKLQSIPALNIEGMAVAKSHMVMANRANKTHPINKLIIAGSNPYDYRNQPPPHIIDLEFDTTTVIGISGLYYLEEKDLLLFTASEEDTRSTTADGAINDSYLGWISHFSRKMKENSLRPQEIIKLSTISNSFVKQKVESVCVQAVEGNELTLHLVSDNDDGASGLFKLRLKL